MLNFVYLSPASQQRDPVYFVAVNAGATINRGERLKTEDLETWGFHGSGSASLMGRRGFCTGEGDFNGVRTWSLAARFPRVPCVA